MASCPTRFFRKDFKLLDPYAPVKPLDVLAEEIGVSVKCGIRLAHRAAHRAAL